MLASQYSNPVHSSHSYRPRSGCHFTKPAASLSLARFPEVSGHIERGRVGSCASSQAEFNEIDVQHMSQNPPVASSDDAPRATNRSPIDGGKVQLAQGPPGSNAPDDQDAVRSRSVSLHPSMPMEPPLEPTQLRPVGIHSLLNPPAKVAADFIGNPSSEGLVAQSPGLPPSLRRASSPTDPSVHLGKRPSLSPGTGKRHILTPISPSARLAGGISRNLPHAGISALHSPLGLEPRGGLHGTGPGMPLLPDPVAGQASAMMGTQPRTSVSLHSTPTFHSRRISAGPVTNPRSHETSPVPHSAYSQFGRSSPTFVNAPASHAPPPPPLNPSLHRTMDPMGRPPVVGRPENASLPGNIQVVFDYKSASSAQAAKRKANSEASKRFRNRQKMEEQMEKKVAAQQEEIRKQAETMQRQAEEIRALLQARDYYRSERDFYREEIGRTVPLAQMPARPPSPRSLRPFQATVSELGMEATRQPLSGAGPAGHVAPTGPPSVASITPVSQGWPNAPPQYPAPPSHERGPAQDEQPARSLPPLPGTWSRQP